MATEPNILMHYAWKCSMCSETCKQLNLPGSLMYNTETFNETGKYGDGRTYAREGQPRPHTYILVYRCSKGCTEMYPLCQTCYDVCTAVEDCGGEKRSITEEYFVRMRTKEYLDSEERKKWFKGGTGVKD